MKGDERIRTAEQAPSADPAYDDLAHATIRMLQALDAYWMHHDGLPGKKYDSVRSESGPEEWWHRFEKYRARVEALARGGAR